MNPFEQKTRPADRLYFDWQKLAPAPYDKNETDPYTKTRIILMNGTEFEAVWFKHQFHRNCPNNDIRRELAVLRRVEQQQQKRIACLKPANESILEHTIGYEQLAVDLTAILAQREPDPYVVETMNLALLEDFDKVLSLNLTTAGKALLDAGSSVDTDLEQFINSKIAERAAAKKAKDFAKADAIREELLAKGIAIKDTREGVVWERV